MKISFGDYSIAPAGVYKGVCSEVKDLGIISTKFGNKRRIKLIFEIQKDRDRYNVSKIYTPSLNERSNLRKDLESWRGKPFSSSECKGDIEIDKLVGKPAKLVVKNVVRNGNTYADVDQIYPENKENIPYETSSNKVADHEDSDPLKETIPF